MLVDTSVWIDHFRRSNRRLIEKLDGIQVWTHPFVIGELACGNLSKRSEVLASLAALPLAPVLEHEDVLSFVDRQRLQGKGLGWIDVHLLASAQRGRLPFWTQDKRLARAADHLGLTAAAN